MELLDDEDDATNTAVVMIPWHPEKQLQLHLLLWDGWFHSPHFSIVRSFGYLSDLSQMDQRWDKSDDQRLKPIDVIQKRTSDD